MKRNKGGKVMTKGIPTKYSCKTCGELVRASALPKEIVKTELCFDCFNEKYMRKEAR